MRIRYEVIKSDQVEDICCNCGLHYPQGAVVATDSDGSDIVVCEDCLRKFIDVLDQV